MFHRLIAGHCDGQAVALGAAVQAGIYEGTVPGVTVMDVWQAALARAFAADRLAKGHDSEPDSDSDFDENEDVGDAEHLEAK